MQSVQKTLINVGEMDLALGIRQIVGGGAGSTGSAVLGGCASATRIRPLIAYPSNSWIVSSAPVALSILQIRSSISWKPSNIDLKLSGPTATMVDSPIAESIE